MLFLASLGLPATRKHDAMLSRTATFSCLRPYFSAVSLASKHILKALSSCMHCEAVNSWGVYFDFRKSQKLFKGIVNKYTGYYNFHQLQEFVSHLLYTATVQDILYRF